MYTSVEWNNMYVLSFQIQLLDIHTLETDINLYVYLTIDVI